MDSEELIDREELMDKEELRGKRRFAVCLLVVTRHSSGLPRHSGIKVSVT